MGSFCSNLTFRRQAHNWWWSYKCGFTIDSTSTQIGMMAQVAEEVKIFLKTQLLQWKVILLILQTQMNTEPSSQ